MVTYWIHGVWQPPLHFHVPRDMMLKETTRLITFQKARVFFLFFLNTRRQGDLCVIYKEGATDCIKRGHAANALCPAAAEPAVHADSCLASIYAQSGGRGHGCHLLTSEPPPTFLTLSPPSPQFTEQIAPVLSSNTRSFSFIKHQSTF